MTILHDAGAGEVGGITPLDTFRSVTAYEEDHQGTPDALDIAAELFDGDAPFADIHHFVESHGTEQGTYTMLGMLSISDGIDVDELARLYERRSNSHIRERGHDTIVALLMDGGYLAVAVSRMALRGIGVQYATRKWQWHDQDASLERAISRAGIDPGTYDRNNIRQHRGGIGSNAQAAALAQGYWNGLKEGGTPSNALRIPGLLT